MSRKTQYILIGVNLMVAVCSLITAVTLVFMLYTTKTALQKTETRLLHAEAQIKTILHSVDTEQDKAVAELRKLREVLEKATTSTSSNTEEQVK